MFGLDAPKITRREFDGSDPQLQLAMAYAASKKSAPTSVSTSAVSSARPSVDDEKQRSASTSSGKSASSLTDAQKKRFSFFRAAGTVLSLK